MDREAVKEPIAGEAPPATPPAGAPAKRKPGLDQRYIAPLLITGVLIAAQLSFGILDNGLKILLSIGTAMATELVLGRLYFGKWPNLASAYVTGISIGIILWSPHYWPYAACAVLSIASKYVLRLRDRHPWNPSNFGVSAMLLLAPAAVASLSVQFSNSYAAMAVIWVLGSFIIWRLKRFHICATYAISFVLFSLVRSAIEHQPFIAEVAPITGPPYQLFIFFMITDPKSTVHGRLAQCVVAFCIAAVECALRLWHNTMFLGQPLYVDVHAPYLALFTVGPIAVLIEIWRHARKRPTAHLAPAGASQA